MNKKIEEVLENHFPKGHSARGEALVLHAIAQIELKKAVQAEREILDDCIERMDRVRNILTKGEPTWDNNWGLLDTKLEKEKIKAIRED